MTARRYCACAANEATARRPEKISKLRPNYKPTGARMPIPAAASGWCFVVPRGWQWRAQPPHTQARRCAIGPRSRAPETMATSHTPGSAAVILRADGPDVQKHGETHFAGMILLRTAVLNSSDPG